MFELWVPALIAIALSFVAGIALGAPRFFWPERYRPNGWIVASFLTLSIGFCFLFAHEVDQWLFSEHWQCVQEGRSVCVRYALRDSMVAGILLLFGVLVIFLVAWAFAWGTGKIVFRESGKEYVRCIRTRM